MRITQTLGRRLSSDRFDAGMGQLASWCVSILVLALGFLKLAALPLTETELFFGVLLVLAVALLIWNVGMLVRIECDTRKPNRE